MDGKSLKENLSNFCAHIDSIKDTMPMSMVLLKPYYEKAQKELGEFSKEEIQIIEVEGEKTVTLKYENSLKFKTLLKNTSVSALAMKIIPESLFVSLISQYDSFLNKLLKTIFQIQPEILNNSQRNLTFSEIVAFGTLEKAREYIVEKEVESVLRESHTSHFEYLETKLGMKLRTGLPIWSTFIEITERRNLFVHCDGQVTTQYFNVCKKNGVPDLDKVSLGERLKVSAEYFLKAYSCLYEIAVKLTHTIWRKLLEDDLENADDNLNGICYDLINAKQFKLADTLLAFACGQKKFFNDATKNYLLVNCSLSQLLNKNEEEAKKIISSRDWSATEDKFKLAYNTIMGNDKEVYALMRKIGKSGDVKKADYKVWPLFNYYRKKSEFKDAYKSIFEEDFLEIEIPLTVVEQVLNTTPSSKKTLVKRAVKKSASPKKKIIKKETNKTKD